MYLIALYPDFQNFFIFIWCKTKMSNKGKEKTNMDIVYKISYFDFQMQRNSGVYFPQMV